MATKFAHNDMLDGSLVIVKSNANLLTVCKGNPATRAAAAVSSKLASVAVSAADFTIASGSSSNGRKVTVGAQNSMLVDSTGSAEVVCLVDAARLILKTTCTKQALTKDNKVNVPAWKDTIADPT